MSSAELCTTDLLVIYILGKHGKMSGSQIHDELRRERAEILDLAPRHSSSIYRSIKKLHPLEYVKEKERKQKRGMIEIKVSLTPKGVEKFHDIEFLLPKGEIFWYIPHFNEFQCEHCEEQELEECWERHFRELDRILRNRVKGTYLFDKNTMKKYMQYPRALLELNYWLRMQGIPKRMLEERFKDILGMLKIDV